MRRTATSVTTSSIHILLMFLAFSQVVHSQSTRAWVSVNGSDTNDCSRATPCRTLATALSRSTSGGEIDVLDSGDFGVVTLNKSISLISPGILGGIQAGTGTAITVNAGSNDRVVLRGLTVDGLGTGLNGIAFVSGGSLYIENCTINGFAQYGLDFSPTNGSGKLFLIDSIVRNNGQAATGGGVHMLATTGPGPVATIEGLRSENNVVGLKAETFGLVTLRNSLAANNGFAGFTAVTPVGSGSLRMFLENCTSTHNATGGVQSVGTGATVVLSNTVVTDNGTGLVTNNGGTLLSFGNNKVQGNTSDGSPTQTISQQ